MLVTDPIPMRLTCPGCGALHIDVGVFATKPHHTHACQHCGLVWRPAIVDTVGVQFLPRFKNEESTADCAPPAKDDLIDGHSRWCLSLNPPPGKTYRCDCKCLDCHAVLLTPLSQHICAADAEDDDLVAFLRAGAKPCPVCGKGLIAKSKDRCDDCGGEPTPASGTEAARSPGEGEERRHHDWRWMGLTIGDYGCARCKIKQGDMAALAPCRSPGTDGDATEGTKP
jgi:hypothetical protein